MSKYIKFSILLSISIISTLQHSVFAADTVKAVETDAQQISNNVKEDSNVEDNKSDNISKINDLDTDKESSINVGWKKNNDGTYSLLDGKGNMVKSNWCKVGGKWYYFNDIGIMQKGWIKSDGKWFRLNNNGNPETGWISEGGIWYYLNDEGEMAIDWHEINGKWYYFNTKGEMLTGWQKIDNKWYYFDYSGKMLSSTVIDGYALGSNGNWIY